jgi:hypothetical protein
LETPFKVPHLFGEMVYIHFVFAHLTEHILVFSAYLVSGFHKPVALLLLAFELSASSVDFSSLSLYLILHAGGCDAVFTILQCNLVLCPALLINKHLELKDSLKKFTFRAHHVVDGICAFSLSFGMMLHCLQKH